MIHFEITESNDSNVISNFIFFQNQINLGKSFGELLIRDPSLHGSHIMIEVVGKDLYIHPQKSVDYFLINGKRATTVRKLKVGDSFQIGSTKINILAFEETPTESKKDILDKKLDSLIKDLSPRLKVIEELTKQMK